MKLSKIFAFIFVLLIIFGGISKAENDIEAELREKLQDFRGRGKYHEAIEICEELIKLQKERNGNDTADLNLYHELAELNIAIGNCERAFKIENGLLWQIDKIGIEGIGGEEKYYDSMLDAFTVEARAFLNSGDVGRSLEINRDVVKIAKEKLGEEHERTLEGTMQLAIDYSILGEIAKSTQMLEEVMPKIQKVFGEQSNQLLNLRIFLTNNYRNMGKFHECRRLIKDQIEFARSVGGDKSSLTLQAMLNLADIDFTLGLDEEANKIMENLEETVKNELSDKEWLKFNILYDIALNYHRYGKNREAIDILSEIAEKLGEILGEYHRDRLLALSTISEYIKDMNNYPAALEYDLNLVKMSRENLDKTDPFILSSMEKLMDSYLNLGRYKEAEEIAKQILNLSIENHGNSSAYTMYSMARLSDVYRLTGNFEECIKLDEEAYKISKIIYGEDSLRAAEYLKLMADTLTIMKRSEAAEIYKNIIEIYEKNNVPIPLYLKINYAVSSGNSEEVIELCKNYREKIDYEKVNSFTLTMKEILAEAYIKMKMYKDALDIYLNMVDFYEYQRDNYALLSNEDKKSWFSTVVKIYKKSSLISFMLDSAELSLTLSEHCRTRSLVDKYAEQSVYKSGIIPDEEIEKLTDYESQLSIYDERINQAQGQEDIIFNLKLSQSSLLKEYNQYREQLEQKYPLYKKAVDSKKFDMLKFNGDENILPSGSKFVEFALHDGLILAYILDSENNLQAVSIDIDGEFLNKCVLYHEILSYPDIDSLRADGKYLRKIENGNLIISNSRQSPEKGSKLVKSLKEFHSIRHELSKYLGEILLTPISEYISGGERLIISPDGELNNIPFETLIFNDKYLISSFDVTYVPSLSILKLMTLRGEENSKHTKRKGLFAMGDAVYDTKNSDNSMSELRSEINRGVLLRGSDLTSIKWNNLPGTKKELEKVSNCFNDSERSVHEGSEATESRLKYFNKIGDLSNYKYILFAAHGLFVPEFPELSSIVLSQGIDKNNDGYITVGEWLEYDLKSDLVYLSACESGLGKYQVGEGIVGIPYALCVAGNKNTVMSLWKVADKQTAKFSSDFFEKLSKGISAGEALNLTKREFISDPNSKYNDPYVWSAFLLYGI